MPEPSPTKLFNVVAEQKDAAVVVRCSGRLLYGVGDQLYTHVRELTPMTRHIILDFTDLAHMDSSGIGILVRAYVHTKAAGCVLELVNIGKPIRQLLGVTHLLDVFETIGRNQIRLG